MLGGHDHRQVWLGMAVGVASLLQPHFAPGFFFNDSDVREK